GLVCGFVHRCGAPRKPSRITRCADAPDAGRRWPMLRATRRSRLRKSRQPIERSTTRVAVEKCEDGRVRRSSRSLSRQERIAEHDRRPRDLHRVHLKTQARDADDFPGAHVVPPAAAPAGQRVAGERAACEPRRTANAVRLKREHVTADVEDRDRSVWRLYGDGAPRAQSRDLRHLDEMRHCDWREVSKRRPYESKSAVPISPCMTERRKRRANLEPQPPMETWGQRVGALTGLPALVDSLGVDASNVVAAAGLL